MISTLIIDDEESNRDVLRTLLSRNCPQINLVDEAGSSDEGFLKIGLHRPQLVLLDIRMPKKSGFDLLKRFKKIDFEVIFITAHDDYAIRAFEFNAIGYILKPVETRRLISAVAQAHERICSKNNPDFVMHFIRTLSDKNEQVSKFSIHHHDKVIFIAVSEISCIQAQGHSTQLSLYDNSQYYSSKELLKFEEVLEGTYNFIRINKSVIININYIKGYSKGETCFIDMRGGQSFEVSRRRKADILKRLRVI